MSGRRLYYSTIRTLPLQYVLLGGLTFFGVCSYAIIQWNRSYSQAPIIALPDDLESRTLLKFDEQVAAGNIHYEPSEAETFTHDGFEFEFRIIPGFGSKSVLRAGDPGRAKAFPPFLNPKPDELITVLGDQHTLLLNKFAVYRPMLVIPRRQFAPQTDELDLADFSATWPLLSAFRTPSVVIYNCGANAGSSQGHKHLQMFPLPAHRLWPSKAKSHSDISAHLGGVPFKHFVLRLKQSDSPERILQIYRRLLKLTLAELVASGSDSRDYNVAMTSEWIALIPRRTAGPNGPFGANAAGILGLVSVPNVEERNWWKQLGYTRYLAELGIPQDTHGH